MLISRCRAFNQLSQVAKHICNYSNCKRSFEEVKIPMPWGHISGKWWEPQNERPILGLHGWQDNSGSFDMLAPSLVPHIGFLALDLPGHGWSSKLPPGAYYHNLEYVGVINRIKRYFNWSKISLLGHSMGGIISYTYSVLFPTNVDFLICLDAFKPFELKIHDKLASNISNFIKYDKFSKITTEPPSYTYQYLEQVLHETSKSVSLEMCKYILNRNIVPSKCEPDKFFVSRDARLKVPFNSIGLPEAFINTSAYRLTCPMFLSRCSSRFASLYDYMDAEDAVIKNIRTVNRDFEFHMIEGTHHVHLNNPERLVNLINTFITKYDVESRSVGG